MLMQIFESISRLELIAGLQMLPSGTVERYRGSNAQSPLATTGRLSLSMTSIVRNNLRVGGKWVPDNRNNNSRDVCIILVGNKCDLRKERGVSMETGKLFARNNELSFVETSALDSSNVESAFTSILSEISCDQRTGLHQIHWVIKNCM